MKFAWFIYDLRVRLDNLQSSVNWNIIDVNFWSRARPGYVYCDIASAGAKSKMSCYFTLREEMCTGTNFLSLI